MAADAIKAPQIPMTPTTGYAPTSFGVNLTGEEAQALADIHKGYGDEGTPCNDWSRVIGRLLLDVRDAAEAE